MKEYKQKVIAMSGIKNSGKTTLITRLIPYLKEKGIKIATIKHDGHDFEPDREGTDTYRHRKSGAYGVGIFSQNKWMIIKEEEDVPISKFIDQFPEADLIFLEGFKYSNYPKIEIVRSEVSSLPISRPETVIAYVSDLNRFSKDIKQFGLDEVEELAEYIYRQVIEHRE